MKIGTVIALLVVVAGGFYSFARFANSGSNKEKSAGGEVAGDMKGGGKPDKAGGDVERFRGPLEGPGRGPATAKVNIVAFSDFQCPFCSRVVPTIDKLQKDYPN